MARDFDTAELPNGGVKEPDAGIGLTKRALQTIVIEVGYSESRAKLRLDADWSAGSEQGQTEARRARRGCSERQSSARHVGDLDQFRGTTPRQRLSILRDRL